MLWMLLFAVAPAVTFEALVASPGPVLQADAHTPKGFRIIALSHAAEACVGQVREGRRTLEDGRGCVDRLAASALDPSLSPWDKPISELTELDHHGLFLSHLLIVLGARDALHPEACDSALHVRLAAHLHDAALAHDSGVGRSFPSAVERWPADQAATLYALWLADRAHGTSSVIAPRERYVAFLDAHPGLPPSEVTGTSWYAAIPRGSAVTFSARYLAPVAPAAAQRLWKALWVTHGVEWPLSGVREWPKGVDHPADIDSGPIVSGIGASATAFGRAAAVALGDTARADALGRTAALGRTLAGAGRPKLAAAADSALAVAIEAQSTTRAVHPLPGP